MASHFDYKTNSRGFLFVLLNEKHKCFWRIITKVIKSRNFKSYFFVYRFAIPFLFADLISFYFLINLDLIFMILTQLIILIFGIFIKRRGLIFLLEINITLISLFIISKKKKN